MSYKLNYLDKKGLAKVFSLIKFGHKKIWHGTLAEWEALAATEKAKYDQAEVIDEYTGVPVVVDKVEEGNLNPVTSNAVAEALKSVGGVETVTGYSTPGKISGNEYIKRSGSIVIIALDNFICNNPTAITGLPKPVNVTYSLLWNGSDGGEIDVSITTNGTLVIDGTNVMTFGQLVYFTND